MFFSVTATWRDPFPGWIDNLNGPTGIMAGATSGLLRSVHLKSAIRVDLVPADMVANLVCAVGAQVGGEGRKGLGGRRYSLVIGYLWSFYSCSPLGSFQSFT